MPVSNPMKTVKDSILDCTGRTTVTISFDAEAELKTVPADIVLVMDRSGSMRGVPLEKAKVAARGFVRSVARASGDPLGLNLAGGSQIGLVSFADTAVTDYDLGTDVARMDLALAGLLGSGLTNHELAFTKAREVVNGGTNTRKVIVLFTDGISTLGNADAIAETIKQEGTEIFCIGLSTDPVPLNRWATDPDAIHVSATDDVNQLNQVFSQAALEVVREGIRDGMLEEVLTPDFQIKSGIQANYGTVTAVDGRRLTWKLDTPQTPTPQTMTLSFDICHVGTEGGMKSVNESLTYTDREQNTLVFPDPQVEISCDSGIVVADPCPAPASFSVDSCRDFGLVQSNEVTLSGLGRIVQVDAVIKNVCPGKRLAAAVVLTEVNASGVELARGTKTLLIPAQTGEGCRDLQVKCIQFVVPEALDPVGNPESLCSKRDFRVRISANYIDTDFTCCDAQTMIL